MNEELKYSPHEDKAESDSGTVWDYMEQLIANIGQRSSAHAELAYDQERNARKFGESFGILLPEDITPPPVEDPQE